MSRKTSRALCIVLNCRNTTPAGDPFCSKHRSEIAVMDNKPKLKVTLDLTPPKISLAPPDPNWAYQRLTRACALIGAVMDQMSPEVDEYAMLKSARDNVENAAYELGGGK